MTGVVIAVPAAKEPEELPDIRITWDEDGRVSRGWDDGNLRRVNEWETMAKALEACAAAFVRVLEDRDSIGTLAYDVSWMMVNRLRIRRGEL